MIINMHPAFRNINLFPIIIMNPAQTQVLITLNNLKYIYSLAQDLYETEFPQS